MGSLTFSCSVVLGEEPAERRHSATPIWPPYTACDRAVKFLQEKQISEIGKIMGPKKGKNFNQRLF
jgi:hypothetical protein